jgi:hypothetical protein
MEGVLALKNTVYTKMREMQKAKSDKSKGLGALLCLRPFEEFESIAESTK